MIKCLLSKNPKIRKINFERIKSLEIFNEINFDLIAKMKYPAPFKPNFNDSIHYENENFLNYLYNDDNTDYNDESNYNKLVKKGIFDDF